MKIHIPSTGCNSWSSTQTSGTACMCCTILVLPVHMRDVRYDAELATVYKNGAAEVRFVNGGAYMKISTHQVWYWLNGILGQNPKDTKIKISLRFRFGHLNFLIVSFGFCPKIPLSQYHTKKKIEMSFVHFNFFFLTLPNLFPIFLSKNYFFHKIETKVFEVFFFKNWKECF